MIRFLPVHCGVVDINAQPLYYDFGKLKTDPVVAQLSKLALLLPDRQNQDRILGYIPIYQSQDITSLVAR